MAQTGTTTAADGDERASVLARSLYYALKDRSVQDQVLVYRALRERLVDDVPEGARQVRALECVQTCATEMQDPLPSKATYNHWRDHLVADRCEWLSDKAIRNAFANSWTTMLSALGSAGQDAGAQRLVALRKYTPAGLLATIAAWHDSLDDDAVSADAIKQEALHAWMKERRVAGDRPDLELPSDNGIWVRHFGGWFEALAAAGILSQRAGASRSTRGGLVDDATNTQRLLEDLVRARDDLKKVPSYTTFNAWVAREVNKGRERNEVLILHGAPVYRKEFGSWPRALYAAGLIDEADMHRREAHATKYTDEQIFECLERHLRSEGLGISTPGYAAWQSKDRALRAEEGDSRPSPSERLLRKRFGSLAAAERATLDARPGLEDELARQYLAA